MNIYRDASAFLKQIKLFQSLSKETLERIIAEMKVISLQGGEVLMRQGDVGTSLYIVVHGRLRAISNKDTTEEILGDISSGEIVGEIGLLVDHPRTATVLAVRNTLLLELKKSAFEQIVAEHPKNGLMMAKMCVERLLKKQKPVYSGANSITITIAPMEGALEQGYAFARELHHELNRIAPTQYLDLNSFAKLTKKEHSDSLCLFNSAELIAWAHAQESQYQFVIYVTTPHDHHWSKFCLTQADRILLVAVHSQNPKLSQIEKFFELNTKKQQACLELVVLQSGFTTQKMSRWLVGRPYLDAIYPVNLMTKKGISRLGRIISGKNIGLVFSGTGARGSSYWGVWKAIKELGYSIDYICGVSSGSIFGAMMASGISFEEGLSRISYVAKHYIRNDYVLPRFSLLGGKNITNLIKHLVNERINIEDLEIPYFCVSTDILKNEAYIHSHGVLWEAVRASCSLPAIFPPCQFKEGDPLLIDGGCINNTPVNLMRKKIGGGKILTINSNAFSDTNYSYPFRTSSVSNKDVIESWMSQKKGNQDDAKLFSIFSSVELAIDIHGREFDDKMQKASDYYFGYNTSKYGFMEYTAYNQLIEIGYRLAMENLPNAMKTLIGEAN